MKKLLNNIGGKLIFIIDILVFPIKKFINQVITNLMDKKLSELLVLLSNMVHEKISDVSLNDDSLSFKYRGGTFVIYKNIQSTINDIGYLKVYHKTPLSQDLKEVEGFYILADNYGQIRITNYITSVNVNPILQAVVQDGTIAAYIDTLANVFCKQFDAKMLKDNFNITPYSY
ncbi:hypothetical protein [Mucilaginibacter ginsenosidivorax]|uniref:Uncharacterized protein n=1 Tax=Mucilaginibacter ginsenosidivorax TaxID=862126 RepID=A0A5B8W2R5_9SPHI|nr:hypothetical protein [Mucilaginibacter ginsenosidivorax]QEC78350.1 hypothetical protein FSB76_21275 [Mucilaginibacter ginsenosidivorax]